MVNQNQLQFLFNSLHVFFLCYSRLSLISFENHRASNFCRSLVLFAYYRSTYRMKLNAFSRFWISSFAILRFRSRRIFVLMLYYLTMYPSKHFQEFNVMRAFSFGSTMIFWILTKSLRYLLIFFIFTWKVLNSGVCFILFTLDSNEFVVLRLLLNIIYSRSSCTLVLFVE